MRPDYRRARSVLAGLLVLCLASAGRAGDCNNNGIPDEEEPPVVYVDDSATEGLDNGSSWDDAYVRLADAITFASCAGTAVCLFQSNGGYCAELGCEANLECPLDATCVSQVDLNFCAVTCLWDDDCRIDDGFGCQPAVDTENKTVWVCVP